MCPQSNCPVNSLRGGILDLFAPDWTQPVRIECFGDEIESIRQFDIQTQRSVAPLDSVEITLLDNVAGDTESLLSFLDPNCLLILIEPDEIQRNGRQFLERHDDSTALDSIADVQTRWARFRIASLHRLAAGSWDNTLRLDVEPLEAFQGDSTEVRMQIDQASSDGDAIVVASRR